MASLRSGIDLDVATGDANGIAYEARVRRAIVLTGHSRKSPAVIGAHHVTARDDTIR